MSTDDSTYTIDGPVVRKKLSVQTRVGVVVTVVVVVQLEQFWIVVVALERELPSQSFLGQKIHKHSKMSRCRSERYVQSFLPSTVLSFEQREKEDLPHATISWTSSEGGVIELNFKHGIFFAI